MGRFNYGVTTLNLVNLALKSKNFDDFANRLDVVSQTIMRSALLTRYNFVKNLKAKEAPILFQHGGIARLHPEETIERLLKTGRASISFGFIGVDDVVRILTDNKENISTPKGLDMAERIMATLDANVKELKRTTGLPVSLYGTPAEASIHTLFQKDKALLKMPKWLEDRAYYTNSFHFSSELQIDWSDKVMLESTLLQYANGGNISYVENSGSINNSMAIVEMIQWAYKCGTQYFAVNTVNDKCHVCGFEGEISYDIESSKYSCPNCKNDDGREMKVQRRSCGYISNYNITHAKKGRMKEIRDRAKHI